MVKFKIGIKFDKHFLNTLKENSNSGVELRTIKHHLALHPIHLNDFNKSIKDLLNQGIAKYNKNLNGILLGYQNITLPQNVGLINNDSCYIHIDLQADFFIFKPEIGKEMQGVVNRRSKDHVGILVYDAFNVSIPNSESDENWLGSTVNIGCEVLFRITYINLSSYLPYIRGELISILSEVDTGVSPKKIKKLKNNEKLLNKKIIFDDESGIEETPSIKSPKKKKRRKDESPKQERKSKKKKVDPNEEQYPSNLNTAKKKNKLENMTEETEKGHKKKNKLKRKHDSDEISLSDLKISELFNETNSLSDNAVSLENTKSELDFSDDVLTSTKIVDDINFIKEKTLKKKDKLKKEQHDEIFIKEELFSDTDLNFGVENTEDKSKNKKSIKRKLSFDESENPAKKHKRKSS